MLTHLFDVYSYVDIHLLAGKQLSGLLLNKKTLEFYKWEGNIIEITARVKGDIESMAAGWSQAERDECVAATADTFRYAGAINRNLMGQTE